MTEAAEQLDLFLLPGVPERRTRRRRTSRNADRANAVTCRVVGIVETERKNVAVTRLDGEPFVVGYSTSRLRGRSGSRLLLTLSAITGQVSKSVGLHSKTLGIRRVVRTLLRELTEGRTRWHWELRAAVIGFSQLVPWPERTRVGDAVDALQQLASQGYICECATGQFGDLQMSGLAARWLRGLESRDFGESSFLRLGGRLLRSVCEIEALDEETNARVATNLDALLR